MRHANKSIHTNSKSVKITEKLLLDNYVCQFKGMRCISDINGIRVWWNYRRHNDGYSTVTTLETADNITLENDRFGEISLMSCHNNHPSIDRIISDINKMSGDEINESR